MPFPLMPLVALMLAVGVVVLAYSTQQISLNFNKPSHAATPQDAGGSDGTMSQRSPGERASRGANRTNVTVAFRVASRTSTGFRGTVTISNHGSTTVPKWALAFRVPGGKVRAVSGAAVVQTGPVVHVRSRSGQALPPGASIRVTYTAAGAVAAPVDCVFNRAVCIRG
ncbi:cellulose binding domain-containing protein [Actinomadura harenae]|uniref:cellulose binding domain-containing protein n=1 Tax=Actinomadura harenae TaxID=2483351 RepID=UPI001F3B9A7C|nr:cellulose binding domain-containing protein [Actinomadura harenae]